MAKSSPDCFKAYDTLRKMRHTVHAVTKISAPRLDRSKWTTLSEERISPRKVQKKKQPISKKAKKMKQLHRAIDILRCANSPEILCLHCRKFGDDKTCGANCYRQFRKHSFISEDQIDIKWAGLRTGYGAFTKPGVTINKGQYLDEYLGDILPIDRYHESLYCFVVPDKCVIDAEKAGNWTRFVNSSCRPNVQAWADFLGKRHVIVFQALKDIGPEEELVFNYGRSYFENAGFECSCDAVKGPHMPAAVKNKRCGRSKK